MISTITSAARFLALHGFTGEGADFSALSSWAGGTWNCPDLPGHGTNSEAQDPEFSIDRLRYSLIPRSPDHLVGVGYSMGGRLLLNLATSDPDAFEKLILISASPGLDDEEERKNRRINDEKWIRLLDEGTLQTFLDQWWEQPVLKSLKDLPAPDEKRLIARRLRNNPVGLIRSLRHHGTGQLPSIWEKCSHLRVPTLICAGENDLKFKDLAERMVSIIPNSQLSLIPDSGHSPHLENPRATAAAIIRFLSQFPTETTPS